MTRPPSDDPRVERLFHEARRLDSAAERDAFLERLGAEDPDAAAEVRDLLEWTRRADERSTEAPRGPAEGDVLGGYRLAECIGEGGFGVVWRARPIESGLPDVAIKLVRSGMDTERVLERFRLEREALGRLRHSGIAAVHGGGRTDAGRPYIVMEYVDGAPVTDHTRGWNAPRIAVLMARICRAVEHAHASGVLHRDIKPSNVLVSTEDGEAVPKVIDFGIARMLTADGESGPTLTGEGQILGSPAYMSPEQAGRERSGERLPIDERTDVFALGRLLFELLTGGPAIQARSTDRVAQLRLLDAVRSGEAESPRARLRATGESAARIPVDVDAITQRATALEPNDRYPSVADLRADLEAFAAGRSVAARRPSVLRRARRYVVRHRVALVPAAVVIAGLGTALVLVSAARDEAAASERRLARTVRAQADLLRDLDVERMGHGLRRALVDQLNERVAARDPAAAEALQGAIGTVDFTGLARTAMDASFLAPAEASIRRSLGGDAIVEAKLLSTIADVRRRVGLVESGLETATRAYELSAATAGETAPTTLGARLRMAGLTRQRGDLEEAEEMYGEVLARWIELGGEDDPRTIDARVGLAICAFTRDEFEAAQEELARVHRIADATEGPVPLSAGYAWNNLGAIHERNGRTVEGVECYRRGRAIIAAALGEDAPKLHAVDVNLGRALAATGDLDGAEALLERAVPLVRSSAGDDHPEGVGALNAMCQVLYLRGDLEEATHYGRLAFEGQRAFLGPTHPETLRLQSNLCMLLLGVDRLDEADEVSQEALALAMDALTSPHVVIGALLMDRSRVLAQQGDYAGAEALALDGIDALEATLPAGHPRTSMAISTLAELYDEWATTEPDADHGASAARWRERLR
ncbi:MAG: serine/threonine-protein kinase [Planctomycetota bacterium]